MAEEGYWDKLSQLWPARAAKGLWEGLMLPGDVAQGNVSMWGDDGHTNPQVVNRAADLAGAVTLGAGTIPAQANTLRAGMQSPKLVVARKMPDGTISYGQPGQIHADLMTRKELATPRDTPEVASSMGYANQEGQFLNRDEALKFAMQNEPQRATWSAQQPEYGLDAATYGDR